MSMDIGLQGHMVPNLKLCQALLPGKEFGGVLYMKVQNKYCLVCARAEKNGQTTIDHNYT